MHEITEAMLKHLRTVGGWHSPKDIEKALYHSFDKRYPDRDTFSRILRRSLKGSVEKGLLVKHRYQHYYHSNEFTVEDVGQLSAYVEENPRLAYLNLSDLLLLNPREIPVTNNSDTSNSDD